MSIKQGLLSRASLLCQAACCQLHVFKDLPNEEAVSKSCVEEGGVILDFKGVLESSKEFGSWVV